MCRCPPPTFLPVCLLFVSLHSTKMSDLSKGSEDEGETPHLITTEPKNDTNSNNKCFHLVLSLSYCDLTRTENAQNDVKTIQINKIFMFCLLLFHNHDSLYGILMSLKHLLFQAQTFIISDSGFFLFCGAGDALCVNVKQSLLLLWNWISDFLKSKLNLNSHPHGLPHRPWQRVHLHHLDKPTRHVVITVVKVLGKDGQS